MKIKFILIVIFLLSNFATIKAQIGIGTSNPNRSAQLDVISDNKGILIPRISLLNDTQQLQQNVSNEISLLIYNASNAPEFNLYPGYYYWSGTHWIRMVTEADNSIKNNIKFFYMPSIIIDTSVIGTNLKRNLHAEYLAQFTNKEFIPNTSTGGSLGTSNRTTFVKSTGAPNTIPNIPTATSLYYYVTDFDETAIEIVDIDANGIMTYNVIGGGTDYSFINIVFVLK